MQAVLGFLEYTVNARYRILKQLMQKGLYRARILVKNLIVGGFAVDL